MDDNTNHPEKQSLKEDFDDTNLDDSKAKFFANGSPEAHVQIDDGSSSEGSSFTGLGKEELMKYANDPFWIRVRKILFIVFWVAWIAMLAAAIVIIVLAPKCPKRPNLKWYQTEVVYQVQPKSFKDTSSSGSPNAGVGDINGTYININVVSTDIHVLASLEKYKIKIFIDLSKSQSKLTVFRFFKYVLSSRPNIQNKY